MTHKISGPTLITSAWVTFKKHWKFIIPAVVTTGVLMAALQLLQKATENNIVSSLITGLISVVIGIAITLGWSRVLLLLVRHQHADWNSFKTDPKHWFAFFLARLLYGLFAIVPMIVFSISLGLVIRMLFISSITSIPLFIITIILSIIAAILCIWIGIRFMFISFVAIDHPELTAWKLLKKSGQITQGHVGKLFLLALLLVLVNIVGAIALIVGLLVSIPLSKIAMGYAYEQLNG